MLLVFLLLARVVSTATLRKNRRWAFLGIVVVSAVITPSQDPFSLFFMAGPLYLFYELSILIGRVMKTMSPSSGRRSNPSRRCAIGARC